MKVSKKIIIFKVFIILSLIWITMLFQCLWLIMSDGINVVRTFILPYYYLIPLWSAIIIGCALTFVLYIAIITNLALFFKYTRDS